MPLTLYNSATRKHEIFTPLIANKVSIYVCGQTVYNRLHIGNGRTMVIFDVLYRLLSHYYSEVSYVRNITDVDDKITQRAIDNNQSIAELTAGTIADFHLDMQELGVLPPTHEPRATAYIDQMIAMIKDLIAKGFAYEVAGHVLFSVANCPNYGHLSRLNRAELQAGARIDIAPYKQDPADFTLWKPSSDRQPGWNSPWGVGRPGWHIECSAMCMHALGKTIDIHGGGNDLLFPHHENEVAQSESVNGAPLSNYWLHSGLLTLNGEKMSKSLGNIITVHDALSYTSYEALRLAMLSTHYRQALDWSDETLIRACRTLDSWYSIIALAEIDPYILSKIDEKTLPPEIENAFNDDLNIPQTIAEIHATVNSARQQATQESLIAAMQALKATGRILGIMQMTSQEWFHRSFAGQITSAEIEVAINKRTIARNLGDFIQADNIRSSLALQGVVLEDKKGATEWRRQS